jgi:hypothetical protein
VPWCKIWNESQSWLNGTHSVNFAMSYRSVVGRTPLISEVEWRWTMIHRISWICSIISAYSSLFDLIVCFFFS